MLAWLLLSFVLRQVAGALVRCADCAWRLAVYRWPIFVAL
jgi:hypothetical protein